MQEPPRVPKFIPLDPPQPRAENHPRRMTQRRMSARRPTHSQKQSRWVVPLAWYAAGLISGIIVASLFSTIEFGKTLMTGDKRVVINHLDQIMADKDYEIVAFKYVGSDNAGIKRYSVKLRYTNPFGGKSIDTLWIDVKDHKVVQVFEL